MRHFRIKPVNANREAAERHLGSRRGPNDSEGYEIARLAFDPARRASVRIGGERDRKSEGIEAGTGPKGRFPFLFF
jgi:hypothetical protein